MLIVGLAASAMGIVLGHAAAQLSAAQSVLFDRGVLLGIEVADGRGGARVPDNVRAAALKSVEGKLAARRRESIAGFGKPHSRKKKEVTPHHTRRQSIGGHSNSGGGAVG